MASTWDCNHPFEDPTVPPQGHYTGYQVMAVREARLVPPFYGAGAGL
jgi:hypothetical protein